jgi:hypothetical protein
VMHRLKAGLQRMFCITEASFGGLAVELWLSPFGIVHGSVVMSVG